jgi:hypothetical protein
MCGGVTAFLANWEGGDWRLASNYAAAYADRHRGRTVPPIVAIVLRGLGRGLRPGQVQQVAQAIERGREFYQSSGLARTPTTRRSAPRTSGSVTAYLWASPACLLELLPPGQCQHRRSTATTFPRMAAPLPGMGT